MPEMFVFAVLLMCIYILIAVLIYFLRQIFWNILNEVSACNFSWCAHCRDSTIASISTVLTASTASTTVYCKDSKPECNRSPPSNSNYR